MKKIGFVLVVILGVSLLISNPTLEMVGNEEGHQLYFDEKKVDIYGDGVSTVRGADVILVVKDETTEIDHKKVSLYFVNDRWYWIESGTLGELHLCQEGEWSGNVANHVHNLVFGKKEGNEYEKVITRICNPG